MRSPETKTMLAGIASGEGESPGGRSFLVYDTMIVVEGFIDSDLNSKLRAVLICLGI